jgi:hypothetical protein
MDDKQRLEEQALRAARLVGVLLHGSAWRERRGRGMGGRLVIGLVLAAVGTAGVAGVSFVMDQLSKADGAGFGF